MISISEHYRQSDDSLCGPACIRTVLKHYGKEISEEEIAKLCNHTYELGTTDADMKRAVEALGFQVYIQNFSDFDDIYFWLKLGCPVIVDWFYGDNSEKL